MIAGNPTHQENTSLNALSPEILAKQATVNIGLIGHVAHGKSSVVKALSGAKTQRHKIELKQNITIKLGYANAKIFKCSNPECPKPGCYASFPSSAPDNPLCSRPDCGAPMNLVRHVSFVDCPGHDLLMATMLTGAAVMDAAILLVAANEPCPQPQTAEHLAAIEIMKLDTVIVAQNKVDLVTEDYSYDQFQDIKRFTQGTVAEKAPVIPLCAQLGYNIDALAQHIVESVPVPMRSFTEDPKMTIIRSFDINKPGTTAADLKGGVAGGSLLRGVLSKNQEVEIRPGVITRTFDGSFVCRPIRTKLLSLHSEDNELEIAVPGGLIGVGTTIDPTLTKGDRLAGQVLGKPGCLPPVFIEIEMSYYLLGRLLGVKDAEESKISNLQSGEVIKINVGSTSAGAKVTSVKKDKVGLVLNLPVCMEIGEKVAISRRVKQNFRLIGWGVVARGKAVTLQ